MTGPQQKHTNQNTKLTSATLYSLKGCLGLVSLKGTLPETKILAKMDGWKISRLCFRGRKRGKLAGKVSVRVTHVTQLVSEVQTFSYLRCCCVRVRFTPVHLPKING